MRCAYEPWKIRLAITYPMSTSVIKAGAASGQAATACVLFFHGLGDSGHGWSFLASEARRRAGLNHVEFMFPSASPRYISIAQGEAPGWFHIENLGPSLSVKDASGVSQSLELADDLITSVINRGIPSNRIVLGGFSQGAALSEATAIVSKHKLAGFVCLSGFLPIIDSLRSRAQSTNKDTPIFMAHGSSDDVVPLKFGDLSKNSMSSSFGFTKIDWNVYPGLKHSADPAELEAVLDFLEKTLPLNT